VPQDEIRSAASSAALQQLVPNLLPRNALVGVRVGICYSTLQLRALRWTQRESVCSNVGFLSYAVPDVLDEPKSLVDR